WMSAAHRANSSSTRSILTTSRESKGRGNSPIGCSCPSTSAGIAQLAICSPSGQRCCNRNDQRRRLTNIEWRSRGQAGTIRCRLNPDVRSGVIDRRLWDSVVMVLPSGTVTFLFTDIEGSTSLWENAPESMRAALQRHDAILHGSIKAHGGQVFSTGGDGLAAVFARSVDAIAAASQAQAALTTETWPKDAPVRVRMGVHTGETIERDGDYFGPALNRAARLMGIGHGGQGLVS